MNRSILIAGCGYVGTELGVNLAAQGFRVFGGHRSPRSLPDSIEPISLNVTDQVSLESLPDVDILVYAISADKFEASAYQAAYPDGVDAILTEYEKRNVQPRHIFFVSSTSVYHQSEGEEVNEESPTEPTAFSGQLMLKAEQRVRNSPISGSIVRLSGIYGPGRERLINQVKEGHVASSEPEIITNRIHRDDAAGIIAFLIQRVYNDQTLAPVYLATDCFPATLHDVTHWLAQRLNVIPQTGMNSSPRRRSNKKCSNAFILSQGYTYLYPTFHEGYNMVIDDNDRSR